MDRIDESDALSLGELCDLFQRVEDGVFFWDSDLRLLARNDLACDLYGLQRDFVQPGLSLFDLVAHLRPGVWARNVPPVDWHGLSEQQTRERILNDFRQGVSFEIRFERDPRRFLVGSRTVFRNGVLTTVITDVTEREDALEALAEQKRLLETILSNLDEGVALLDVDESVVVYNRRLVELYRMDPDAVRRGDPLEHFVSSIADAGQMSDAEREALVAARLGRASGPGQGTLRFMRELRDGRTILVTRTGLPGGRAVLSAQDVTDEAEIARQRSYLKVMIESVSEGVMLLDRDRNIVALNRKLLDHYKIPPGMFWPGLPAARFVEVQRDLDDLPEEEKAWRKAERLEHAYSRSTERSTRRRELGTGRVLQITRIPLPDGAALGIYRDVTAEEEREDLLNRARREAEQASRMKSEFLARISHELRTPMQGVLGMAALLERTELDERQTRFLETIRASGQHMLRLIEDLLTLSSEETTELKLHVEPLRVERLLGEVVDVVRPMADERGLSVKYQVAPDADTTVRADSTRLFQILTNLMTNAVRYTGEGSVSLAVSATPGSASDRLAFAFAVADTGRGIPAGELDRIWERFYQIEAGREGVKEGFGLGLAVASSLARAMGGHIDVRSTVGKGSVFTLQVEFPVEELGRD